MSNIVINDGNLDYNDLEDFKYKVRAFLVDDNNNVLIANYGHVFLLPGGSIDINENAEDAIVRELQEETGMIYQKEELDYLITIDYYSMVKKILQ